MENFSDISVMMTNEMLKAYKNPSRFVTCQIEVKDESNNDVFSAKNTSAMLSEGCMATGKGSGSEAIVSLAHILVMPTDRIFGNDQETAPTLIGFIDNFSQGNLFSYMNIEYIVTMPDGSSQVRKQKKFSDRLQASGIIMSGRLIAIAFQCMKMADARQEISADKKVQGTNSVAIEKPNQLSRPELSSKMPGGTELFGSIISRAMEIISETDNANTSNVVTFSVSNGDSYQEMPNKLKEFQWEASCEYGAEGEGEHLQLKYLLLVFNEDDEESEFVIKEKFSVHSPFGIKLEKKIKQNNTYKTITSFEFTNATPRMFTQCGKYFVTLLTCQSVEIKQYIMTGGKPGGAVVATVSNQT